MVWLMYEARPTQESDYYRECGGAYINCWVLTVNANEAESRSRSDILHSGWEIIELCEGPRSVERSRYVDDEEALASYDAALTDGAAYDYYTWPKDEQ